MTVASQLLSTARPKHPYPGLRPFETDEWSIFFGRERMIDEVIDRLAAHHLVLIHGSSGSGKSSLVRAGVLPKLARQHKRFGEPWLTCSIRPSGGPLWNLAKEFARLEGAAGDVTRIGEIVRAFNGREATLSSVAASLNSLKGRRLCILVDQFEELFRFEKETSREEAELFVDLLVRGNVRKDAATQDLDSDEVQSASAISAAAVHVVVTMRSEFLGECARFKGLAEAINRTQYLVPGMDREALLRAIRRPAMLYAGEVSLDLAERLVAEAGGREDELPLIQHGLMYLWNDASAAAKLGEKITLDATLIDQAGGLVNLLSHHADAIVNRAAPDQERKDAVERLFRALSELTAEGRAIRSPQPFRDLVAVIAIDPTKLHSIIDVLRADGVSFLTPYSKESIGETTPIDISHEALIRCWHRLADPQDGWLKREFDDGLIWRSLHIEAKGFETDKRRILSPATTEERWKWWNERRITARWAERYGGDFALVEQFITSSREEARKVQEQAEISQRKKLEAADQARRELVKKRIFSGSIAASIVLCLLSAVSIWQWRAASRAQIAAEASEKDAVAARSLAQVSEKEAVAAKSLAEQSESAALITKSHSLADRANKSMAIGDVGTAALLAVEALPDANNPENRVKEATPDAKKALSYALQRLQENVVLNGHTDSVSSVMFNPVDPKMLVTAGWDKTVLLWDLSGRKPVSRVLGRHDDPVHSVDFSADGNRVLTSSYDNTARIWDVATQKQIRKFVGHTDWVQSAVFSPGTNKYVLTGSRDKTTRLWDAETERLVGTIKHNEPVQYAAFSPNGSLIVTASGLKIDLWDTAKVLESGAQVNTPAEAVVKPLSTLSGHTGSVLMVVFSRDGKKVVSASFDKTAKVWDVSDPSKPVPDASFAGHEDLVFGAIFSPDTKTVLTTSIDETARLWDVGEKRLIALLRGHNDGVWHAAFSPDGQTIATTSFDRTVRLWKVSGRSESGILEGHKRDVWFAAFSPNEKLIATASFDKTVRVWDAATQREVWKSPEYGDWVRTVAFSRDSRSLVTTSDRVATVWDLEKKQSADLKGHTSIVSNAVFSPVDAKIILTSSFDKTARLWNAETREEISRLEGHSDFLMSAAFSPDGKTVVTASRDKTAKLWDVSNPAKPVEIGSLTGHETWVEDAAFSSDGKMIATASWDKTVRLWDVGTRKQLAVLVGGAPARTVRFSPDNRMIITTADNTARLWEVNLANPIELQVLKGHRGIVRSAVFSPTGYTILTASSDGTAKQWPVDPASQDTPAQTMVDKAKQDVPRCLTVFQRKEAFLDWRPPTWCIEMEKWPYDTKDWKIWLEAVRAKENPPQPGSVEWEAWLSSRMSSSVMPSPK